MNKIIPLVFLCSLLAGCATTTSNTERWAVVAKIAARRGTTETLRRHPEYRPAFEAALAGVDALLLTPGPVSREALLKELQKLPVKELHGEEGALLFADAFDLFDAVLGDRVALRDGTMIRTIAVALAGGVRDGLALSGP